MSTVNLYKIDNGKSREFYKSLREKMEEIETIEQDRSTAEDTHIYNCTLYLSVPDEEKTISWSWILREFNTELINTVSSPKAVLVIEHNYDTIYAITFGHAFFLVDKYCDRDYGFAFGRKLQYEEIKTTTLTTPGLRRNKVVNTYVVDQSLTSLKMYKAGKLSNIPEIDTVAIWIVLERKTHIDDEDGNPNVNLLDMLMLKNRLDQWKKEVRLQGFKPIIWINYMND